MSSRVLKKMTIMNDLEIKEEELSDDTEEIQVVDTKKPLNINRYDLLNQQSLSESEVKEDDNETEGYHASPASATSSNLYACEQNKKKKKKKKRKTGKSTSQRRSSEDNADGEDDITKTVKEVDKLFETAEQNITRNLIATRSLLSIQHKNLNPSYEMKRMFGNKVVQSEQNKRRNNSRGGQRTLKSTWLVNPKDNWPPVGKSGIYMNLVQPNDITSTSGTSSAASSTKADIDKGAIYFTFEHSPVYRQIQQTFLNAVESMDSDNIIKIINQQPYHIDSLIQLSELCKMSEDHAMASELIEHAILALESSFHSMFSLTQGNCRLDYRRQESRAIFVVLFKHSQYLENRACSRTALEIAKLILTFDPINDPLAIILLIDFYALRCKQYDWLVQLYHEWELTNNLSQLPNMVYSYALALFHLNRTDAADKAIQYALLMFPSVLKLLFDELSIQADARVMSHKYFSATAYSSQPIGLQQLTSLYVCRSKTVWKDTEILPWLERNVKIVLDRVDAKDEVVSDYATKRSQRYLNPPRTILRHIILSDFKEKVPLAQIIKKETEPILMYDPLPPLDSINIYTKPTLATTARTNVDGSPISMFFQSLLPSFSLQQNQNNRAGGLGIINPQAMDDAAGGGAAIAAGGGDAAAGVNLDANGVNAINEFRTSLHSIVDAMRDFLSDIRVLERPNDADVDDNETTDDEPNDYLT